ncbi:PAS domain S-box protein [Rhizobium calliandrae]|uniref:histidine kinase n=1 Tax=Rhizobium calliandrae TaxID=1312182 RepID=A0ABT7KIQ9_9HYPH|nr:PAS domain-containing sensor histidine kinase [Rhizobium calliandrae]MDL2408525.1 PAS domain S-box protein [Rhizobium calliandrae]
MTANVSAAQSSILEGHHRLLVDAITDYAIYMLDPHGLVISWNIGAQRSKGYTEAEIIGEHFSRFYIPEDREAGLPQLALKTATETGRFENEGWYLRKDGSRYWAHAVIDAIRNAEGDLLGFAKITRDLSGRRMAELELKRSEEQFRILVQGVADYAIYMLDPRGHVSSWNLGAQRIKGYTQQEILGQHFSRFYTQEDRTAGLPWRALDIAAKDGRFENEGWRVRKDGSRFWASVVIDAIRTDDGFLLGFAKVTRDITEKREAQRKLEQAKEELFQAQKMEAVGQLTGGMAHDFNNLLMAVLGSLEILRKRVADNPSITPFIDNAIQGAQRGAALTQRMLAFSRRQELKLEPLDVTELVRNMTDLLQGAMGPSMMIETHFPLSLPRVKTDPNQLENALLNLAVNARDAMPKGGSLVIAARLREIAKDEVNGLEAGAFICLSLKDEGEGMDEETLANATTPFFTTKGVGKGTGLGLSMVQGLMAQSGGKLVLKSCRGAGTTAELWLPVAAETSVKMEEPVAEAAPAAGGSFNILAVDDDALVLMNTAFMLEDLGHTVLQAHSGEEALKLIEDHHDIHLVITDHSMPRMTGSEFAAAIAERMPDLPVILASGYAELPAGSNNDLPRLAKPFNQQQLAAVIAKAIGVAPVANQRRLPTGDGRCSPVMHVHK